MEITIRKALAINCWDVLVNGELYERFDRKYQAAQCAKELERLCIHH